MNVDDEQSGKLLVYRSSAGSGKTSTLVSTFLRLALEGKDPARYSRTLAITFTNKAAREMKERVLSELAALAEGAEASPPTRNAVQELGLEEQDIQDLAFRTLTHILHHYSRLSISTIDRFVHRIVQQFARELEVPIDFELTMEEDEVLRRAVDALISRAGSEKGLTEALTGFASAKADDDKSWHIEEDLLEASRTLLDEEGRWVWDRMKGIGPERIIEARKKLGRERARFEEEMRKIGDRGLELIRREGIQHRHFYRGQQGGVPSYLKKLKKGDPSELAPNEILLKALEEDKWTSGKCPSEEAERIHRIEGELGSLLEEAIRKYQEEGKEHLLRCLLHQELFRSSLLSGVDETLERMKEEEGFLLISDLDRIIARLILHEPAPFIYERIGDRYDHILLDEFQDTSILQWQNLLPLVENSLSEGNTVMLVGDGKQAIYRWRNGDVEQFLKLPQIHKGQENGSYMKEKEELLYAHFQEERLQENYRSAPIIVRTNNEIFPVMNRILMEGAEQVGMDEFKALFEEGGQETRDQGEEGYVRFERIATSEQVEGEKDPMTTRCMEILQGPLKNAPASDIAILTRTNAEGARIAAALMGEGIEVLSSESLHLDQSEEILFLIELLRLIADPDHEIAKLEGIRYLLQHQDRSEELHERLADHWVIDGKGRKGKIDIASVWQDLEVEFDHEQARNAPLYRIVEDAIRSFQLDDPASPYLQFFLDHVFQFSERHGDDIQAFLEDWDGMRNKPSIKIPDELNAVRVMTIHSAKGLEFPHVVIPGPERQISYSKDRIWVDPNGYIEDLPAALLPMNRQLAQCPEPYASEELKERYRSRLDSLDLLYVAMTRAESSLFVLIQEPPKNPSYPNDLLDHTLMRAIQECYGDLSDEGIQFGSLPENFVEKDPEGELDLERVSHEAWDDRVKIRFKAPKDPELYDPEPARKAGELIHEALARTERKEMLPRALDELQSEGYLGKTDREGIEEHLDRLIQREELRAFFEPGEEQKLLCERDILTPQGHFIRPDRVILEGERAKVLEIKTGGSDPSHHRQLRRYRDALREMGYRVEAHLLYTQDERSTPLREEEG